MWIITFHSFYGSSCEASDTQAVFGPYDNENEAEDQKEALNELISDSGLDAIAWVVAIPTIKKDTPKSKKALKANWECWDEDEE